MFEWLQDFKIEPDNWWWERLRLDEFGISSIFNFNFPDKLSHFLTVFIPSWILCRKFHFSRFWSCFIPWFIMVLPWEIIWDGCFRYGFSVRDVIADTLGALVAYWWLGSNKIGQT